METVRPYLIDLETTNGPHPHARLPPQLRQPLPLTLQPGTYLKSGAAWTRIDVARYYELKDGEARE